MRNPPVGAGKWNSLWGADLTSRCGNLGNSLVEGAISGLARGLNSGRVSMRGGPCPWPGAGTRRRIVGVKDCVAWRGKAMPLISPKFLGITTLVDGITFGILVDGTGSLDGSGKTPGRVSSCSA